MINVYYSMEKKDGSIEESCQKVRHHEDAIKFEQMLLAAAKAFGGQGWITRVVPEELDR